jgi:integrase
MISQAASFASPFHAWHWPIDCARYDCSPAFTEAECQEIAFLAGRTGNRAGGWPKRSAEVLCRLLQPLEEVCRVGAESYAVSTERTRRASTICAFVREMSRQRAPYWAWDRSVWIEFITPSLACFNTRLGWSWTRESKPPSGTRLRALLAAYLFEALPDVRVCGGDVPCVKLASLVFGWGPIEATLERIMAHLLALGYSSHKRPGMMRALCTVLLLNRSPYLEDVTSEGIRWVYETSSFSNQSEVATLSRALTSLGMLKEGIDNPVNGSALTLSSADGTLSPEWEDWCQQWRALSTLEPPVTRHSYTTLLMIGRWLQREHPDITSPTGKTSSLGKPINPRTIHSDLSTLRRFFKDLQESEKIPCLFNPDRYLALPRSVRHKIGPDPRVIDRPLWAKLVWAGQHLAQEDLPSAIYPLEMIRAVAAVWLFTALRSDEICRLRLGCIEWPATDIVEPETEKRVSREQVCYLHIPANKTSPAFKKPVAPYVGKMIAAWEQVQPHQEPVLDRKSAEKVAYLFSMRGRRLGANYLNAVLIPLLATKANVPPLDHRGRVTSHRARATIATFLGNCENPMSLWQLMRWLGHRTEATTRNYVDADMTKVAVKVAEGSFLQQNLASIPVFIDHGAISSGAASKGQPWKYFDLGHGFCTLPEWAACRHRMACAKCDCYEPKQSSRMQLLEANGNLTRMLEFVTLGDEERTLVEQGIALNQQLLARLADEPTPAGPTPRELQSGNRKLLPMLTETIGLVQQEDLSLDEEEQKERKNG